MASPSPAEHRLAASSRALLLPAVLAVAVHLPVLAAPLLWDDGRLLLEPLALHRPDFWREILTRDYGWEFAGRPAGYFRPLFVALAWALRQIAGPTPFVFHLVSLLAFVGLTALAASLFQRLFPASPRVALALGCVFAVHPLNTDIVLFFTSLPDLAVAAAAAGLMLLTAGERRAATEALGAAALAAAGALSKESGFLVLGPMAAVLLAGRRWPAGAGALAGLALAFGLRLRADLLAVPPSALLAPLTAEGSGRGLAALVLHAQHFVLPIPRIGPREFAVEGHTALALLAGLVLLLPLVGAGAALWLRRLPEALCQVWLAATLHGLMTPPALGLLYSERYGSLIPLLWLAGAGALRLRAWLALPADRLRLLTVVAGLWVAALAVASLLTSGQALSARAWWSAVLEDEPGLVVARLNLSRAWRAEGNLTQAEAAMEEARRLAPDDLRVVESLVYLAELRFLQGRYDAALEALAERQRLAPGDPEAASLRALCLYESGRRREAVAAIRAALATRPDSLSYRFQFLRIGIGQPGVSVEELLETRAALAAAGMRLPEEAADEATLRRMHSGS